MIHPWELQYLSILNDLLVAPIRPLRSSKATEARAVTGRTIRVDLRNHKIPLPVTKKLNYRACFDELMWMLRGETNVAGLRSRIWDQWADADGDLGPVYGKQWRDWDGHDQIAELLDRLESDPFSTRHVVSTWNVRDLPDMALPPCLYTFQMDVDETRGIRTVVSQRSADMPVGVPFNLLAMATLTHLVAEEMALRTGNYDWHGRELVWNGANCHVYVNQIPGVQEQLRRVSVGEIPNSDPRLVIEPSLTPMLERLDPDILNVMGYDPLGPIKFEVAK